MLAPTVPRGLWHPIWIIGQAARVTGVLRLTSPASKLSPNFSQGTRDQVLRASRNQPKAVAAQFDASIPESNAQAEGSSGFGDRPLIVLTRGKVGTSENLSEEDRLFAAYEQLWMNEIQPKLTRLSSRGRQVVVRTSGHRIHEEAPEAVVAAIREVLMDLRTPKQASTPNVWKQEPSRR